MREIRISRDEFVRFCGEYKKCWEAFEKLEDTLDVCLCESPIWEPMNCWYDLVNDLFNFTEEEEQTDWGNDLSFFCFDLNFGEDYFEGCITDDNDRPIDISTPQKFYDYMVAFREAEDEDS